ncbi:MAG: hypothetical protein H7840_17650 [Alphaproteobacteria bacterium]
MIKALFPALKNQARFKPEEMAAALDEEYFSRYLIAPRRWAADKLETYGIACGLLSGFGGFLSEEFRAHDYGLGRANCYQFLKEHFALPKENQIIHDGYLNSRAKDYVKFRPNSGSQEYYQIIPVLPTSPVPPLGWPKIERRTVEDLVAAAKDRAKALVKKALADKMVKPAAFRVGLRALWWVWGEDKVAEFVRWSVLSDLIRRDQLNWLTAGKPESERKVMAALADPAYDLRTPEGIAARERLEGNIVSQVLATYKDVIWWDKDRNACTLDERKPSLLSRLTGVGEPTVDWEDARGQLHE